MMRQAIGRMAIGAMRLLAWAPLPLLRALGWLLGQALYLLAAKRRKVALRNLDLCFPSATPAQRRAWARETFVRFCQSWLDRSWLWFAPRAVVERRLNLCGALHELQGDTPTIIFAPHFYGMDAAGTAIMLRVPDRPSTSIFTPLRNKAVDAAVRAGRQRFGDVQMLGRHEGIKTVLGSLRKGGFLYLLPDMNFGAEESIFVPFYGVPAATLPSLSRIARLGRAKVVPVVARMTRRGYDARVMPAWPNYPSNDVYADTALMNERLQGWIDTMPGQYYWVHKRFKTRPPGEPPVY